MIFVIIIIINKNDFIIKRKSIFDTYELPALSMIPVERLTIRTAYQQAFTEWNNIVRSINSRISDRTGILASINNIIDAKKTSINSYFTKFFNISEDQLPNNLTRILDANGENFGGTSMPFQAWDINDISSPESQYEMVRPINFS